MILNFLLWQSEVARRQESFFVSNCRIRKSHDKCRERKNILFFHEEEISL
jgi:hypothetical protein